VGGCQRHPQRPALGIAGEHHHHQRRAGFFGEIFGVASKRHASGVDHALVHRRRRHRGKFAGNAASQGPVEQFQDIGAVGRVELTGDARCAQRLVQHPHGLGARFTVDRLARQIFAQFDRDLLPGRAGGQVARVAHPEEGQAVAQTGARLDGQFGADPGGFAAGDGDQRRGHCSSRRYST